MNEIRFYSGETFTENDVFEFVLNYKNTWFDYCPIEGVCDFKTDKSCLCHIIIVDNGDHFIMCYMPNINKCEFEKFHEDYKKLIVSKLNKKDVWERVNDFNNTSCIYKIGEAVLGDEALTSLGGETLLNLTVNSYEECSEFLALFNIKDFVF